ncbi:amidohydrolase family protein [Lunatibacter salilacus]|uniref:amidohydrolase family protein n=1 Tax=Lunatibacter salilacus TaxID=2483804 RepID=UPI001F319566|nr:amidohydrolase family protein [Lunatibacter salilacus]
MTLLTQCDSPKETDDSSESKEFYTMEDFQAVKKYDAHVHLWKEFDTLFLDQALADNFALVNVSVYSSPTRSPESQDNFSLQLLDKYPKDLAFISTFSLEGFNESDWTEKTLSYLQAAIDKGAVGVKVWKNIGLELKNKDDEFVMIDDKAFEPIVKILIDNNIPLLGHLGEPKNTWLPIEEMTVKGDRDYFSENPKYHMYLHPEYPDYDAQMAARDRLLEINPNLNFVGAHLGSLEWSVDELAKRLDKYPNMSVDLAERISHLQHQAVTNWLGVHDFLVKYQDRIIYGTDLRTSASDITGTTSDEIKNHAHEVWLRHWRFFVTDDEMEVPKVTRKFKGMKLPSSVVDKIYRTNAEKWFPRLNQKPI